LSHSYLFTIIEFFVSPSLILVFPFPRKLWEKAAPLKPDGSAPELTERGE